MSLSIQTTSTDPEVVMRSYIQKIATGPEYSKDLSFEEARTGMRLILEGKVHPVQAGVFLIALRMKRETDDENRGALQAILDVMRTTVASVNDLVDVADPFDGFIRGLPASPFLPPVLAACGLPAVSHGLERVGPKYGVTHRQVLCAAGVDVECSLEEAARRIGDAAVGWSYVDQKSYCPSLHRLVDLRALIVKRPCITTVEVVVGPIRGRHKTHLMTGYVHKAYPAIYALLARHSGFDSALIVRGVEGGVIPSLQQPAKVFFYQNRGEERHRVVEPGSIGIAQLSRAVPLPDDLPKAKDQDDMRASLYTSALAKAAAEAGIAALKGNPGPTRDSLVYAGALCLQHLERFDSLSAAANAVRRVLDSGKALARLHACNSSPDLKSEVSRGNPSSLGSQNL
jgi:Anthranilate phosphoribosyltransferase